MLLFYIILYYYYYSILYYYIIILYIIVLLSGDKHGNNHVVLERFVYSMAQLAQLLLFEEAGGAGDLVLHRLDSAFTSTWRDAASLVATSSANTVDKVWVDGELVVDDGHLTRVDEGAIAEGAATARAALFDRVPGL